MTALHRHGTFRFHDRGTLPMVTDILAVNQSLSSALTARTPRLSILSTGIYLSGRPVLEGRKVMSVGTNLTWSPGRFHNLF